MGEVKSTTPKTNGKYEFVDYEASKLKKGTKIYELDDESVAVKIISYEKIYQKYKKITN